MSDVCPGFGPGSGRTPGTIPCTHLPYGSSERSSELSQASQLVNSGASSSQGIRGGGGVASRSHRETWLISPSSRGSVFSPARPGHQPAQLCPEERTEGKITGTGPGCREDTVPHPRGQGALVVLATFPMAWGLAKPWLQRLALPVPTHTSSTSTLGARSPSRNGPGPRQRTPAE